MDLKSYLLSVKKVKPNQVSYFLFWIEKYKQACKSNPDKAVFYQQLEKKYEIWQVQQARKAVAYYKSYCSAYSISPTRLKNLIYTGSNASKAF